MMVQRVQTSILRAHNLLHETWLGIDTRENVVPKVRRTDSVHYATLPYRTIYEIISELSPAPSDHFVDIGCGKGRVICVASRFNLKEVIGVECDPELFEWAKKNVARMRGRVTRNVRVIEGYAEAVDYETATLFFLFNPFGRETMLKFVEKVRMGVMRRPRKISMAYVYPIEEDVLANSGWLEQTHRWEAGSRFGLVHPVSFHGNDGQKGGQTPL